MWTQVTQNILRCIYKFKYISYSNPLRGPSGEPDLRSASSRHTVRRRSHPSDKQSIQRRQNKLQFFNWFLEAVLLQMWLASCPAGMAHWWWLHAFIAAQFYAVKIQDGSRQRNPETYYGRITFKISEHVLWTPTVKYVRIHNDIQYYIWYKWQ